MGRRGPAPTPTSLLRMRGSWRATGREGEPSPPVEAPTCPAILKGEARAEWRRVVQLLVSMGCLAKVDRAGLTAYCDAWGIYCELARRIDQAGYDSPDLWRLLRARSRIVEELLKWVAQFGLSPAARPRLRAVGPPEEIDPLDKLIDQGRSFRRPAGVMARDRGGLS